jgi:pimeloyl-ACP methyl ester carboxylesterase
MSELSQIEGEMHMTAETNVPVPEMSKDAVTAGFLNTDWNPRNIPEGTATTNVVLRTADKAATGGTLYQRGAAKTVVCIMHPREFMACHYLIPDLIEAGCAAWTQSPRSVGNDIKLEHEFALYDVAAGMAFLKQRGFDNIILLGNSGGCGLYALYIQQAGLPMEKRIALTPGGRKTNLAELAMPQADGLIFVAPHPGQGELLMRCIDPSVTDETDPFSSDPTLDPFDPANGYREAPESSSYAPEFIARYRQAQEQRVQRLDERARALVANRIEARKRWKSGGTQLDRRLGALAPIMTIWRTDADLRNFDLTLDPSDRHYGSLWGKDPFTSNWGSIGFGRICSPESWLSTWSGLSSNAILSKTVTGITVPALLVEYSGDQACFPSVVREIYESLGSGDKRHIRLRGDHHGRALSNGEEPGRYEAGRRIGTWLKERNYS